MQRELLTTSIESVAGASARDVSCGEYSHNSRKREELQGSRRLTGMSIKDDWEIDFLGLFQGKS